MKKHLSSLWRDALVQYKCERRSSGFLQREDSSAFQKVSLSMSKLRNSTDYHCEDDEENKKKLIISLVL